MQALRARERKREAGAERCQYIGPLRWPSQTLRQVDFVGGRRGMQYIGARAPQPTLLRFLPAVQLLH